MRITDKLEKQFIRKVLQGDYPPGTQIPSERELAATFQVGRPVIREVMQRLERDGWLTIRNNQRAQVNDYWKEGTLMTIVHILSQADGIPNKFVIHLLELRKNLSPAYTYDAVKGNPIQVIALLMEGEAVPDEPQAFAEYDWKLQRAFAAESTNPIYLLILNSFQHLYVKMAARYFAEAAYREASRKYYAELLQTVINFKVDEVKPIVQTMMEQSIKMWKEQTEVK
jgi:GntR family negative regulator for fad regulon and positive regulator of fabA